MLTRLRHRAQGQEGFTLIELLVVILIIGILAAVAIPVFLNQQGKAQDASVKSDINSAQTAEETYYTDNQAYTAAASGGADSALLAIEPSLKDPIENHGTNGLTITLGSGTDGVDYTITETSNSKVAYTLVKNTDGSIGRTCVVPANTNRAGCKADGTW